MTFFTQSLLAFTTVAAFSLQALACSTVEEASQKIQALSQSSEYSDFMASASTAEDVEKVQDISSKFIDIQEQLSKGDFAGACQNVDAVAEAVGYSF